LGLTCRTEEVLTALTLMRGSMVWSEVTKPLSLCWNTLMEYGIPLSKDGKLFGTLWHLLLLDEGEECS